MLKTALYVNMIVGSILLTNIAQAGAEIPRFELSEVRADLHRVDLSTLTDRDKRRLDFYAGRIIEEIVAISELEVAGDDQGVDSKLATTRTMAERFTNSSEEVGLTADEARQYFLVQMMGNFSGRLPDAFMSSTGIFDMNLLFLATDEAEQPATNVTGGYVDLFVAQPKHRRDCTERMTVARRTIGTRQLYPETT